MLTEHYETSAFVPSPMDRVFAFIDDHTRLSSHMSKSSWKMGGGRMEIQLDEAQGKSVGSRIRLAGRAFGIELSVEEVVTERNPPHRKVWETMGSPKLLVIGPYRMGCELTPQENGSMLRVFIDYALPEKTPARWLGRLFGRYYAKWCTQQMVNDALKHFASLA
ncbi:MAG: SRPBCC family protein [Pseudomonadota bacterium]